MNAGVSGDFDVADSDAPKKRPPKVNAAAAAADATKAACTVDGVSAMPSEE